MFTLLKRIINAGWQNFKRQGNLSFANCLTLLIAICLISGIFIFKKITDFFVIELKNKADISVFFKEGVEEEKMANLKNRLNELGGIIEIEYISKEEALERFKEKHKEDHLIMASLEEIGSNPFLASFNIKAENSEDYQKIFEFLSQEEFKEIIEKIDYFKRKEIIEKIFLVGNFIEKFAFLVFGILVLISIIITLNTVRLTIYAQKEEIAIMRLVGASNFFIKTPFLIQGIISALLAVLISFLLVWLTSYFLAPKIESFISLNIFQYLRGYWVDLIKIQLISGLLLGSVPAFFAIEKYLKI